MFISYCVKYFNYFLLCFGTYVVFFEGVESLRTSMAPRTSSRTVFEVLGLEFKFLALKPTSTRKGPVLGSRTALFFVW